MTIACVTASSTRVCNICWKLGQREGGIEGGGEERVMCMCNITLQGLLLLWLVLLKVHGDCWRLLVKWVMQKARLRNRVWGGGEEGWYSTWEHPRGCSNALLTLSHHK